jgi:prophage DNA circulation protein
MSDLYAASLNGFPLAIETISDEFAKAIARYEFPYRDGAELEDMGQKARTIRFKCYFWDGGDSLTYDLHKAFVASLAEQTLFEFVHPEYGPIMGCVETVSVVQDDRQRLAEVDIGFVENLRGAGAAIAIAPAQDVVGSCEEAFSTNILQSIAAFGAEAQAFLGAAASAVVNQVLNPAEAIAGQFVGLSMQAFSFVEGVANGIAAMQGYLPTVQNSTTSILAATNFAPNLPGLTVQAVAQACERMIINRQGLEVNPTNWSATIAGDVAALIAAVEGGATSSPIAAQSTMSAAQRVSTVTIPKIVWTQAASAAALELASIYAADQANWVTAEQAQLENAFDVLGNYVYPDVPGAQLMTQTDLEQTLSDVRTIIEGAIDFMRANDVAPSCVASSVEGAGSSLDALKQSALALQNQVSAEILERDTLVEIAEPNPLPLHLICLQNGLPYNTAEQLWALNKLANPSAVTGNVWIYQQN